MPRKTLADKIAVLAVNSPLPAAYITGWVQSFRGLNWHNAQQVADAAMLRVVQMRRSKC